MQGVITGRKGAGERIGLGEFAQAPGEPGGGQRAVLAEQRALAE